MTPAEQALAYARDRGWPVFPTRLVRRPNGGIDKIPCIKEWPTTASRDPDQIRAWWRRWPDAVISIPTGLPSGIIILDIDVKDGRNGFDTLADLGRAILPDTPISHTPSGGVHVWFARTDVEIRNSAGAKGLGTGLDIRGDGGQVVLPSPDSGYWWDPHLTYDTVALLPAPAWLGHRPRKESSPASANSHRRFDPRAFLDEACRRIRYAPDGSKHDTYRQETFRVATLVRDGLLIEREARHALEAEIMPLGKRFDGDTERVEKYYNLAFAEGLVAPSMRTKRRPRR
jgi:hypothetical protein